MPAAFISLNLRRPGGVYIDTMNLNDPVGEAKAQAKDVLQKATDQISEHASHLQDVATDARYHAEDFIQANPWIAVSLAAGVGFAVGIVLARR
jgi:ElaB/YqjD/DUF883 family membrane-anchored ribosome-binding protein